MRWEPVLPWLLPCLLDDFIAISSLFGLREGSSYRIDRPCNPRSRMARWPRDGPPHTPRRSPPEWKSTMPSARSNTGKQTFAAMTYVIAKNIVMPLLTSTKDAVSGHALCCNLSHLRSSRIPRWAGGATRIAGALQPEDPPNRCLRGGLIHIVHEPHS